MLFHAPRRIADRRLRPDGRRPGADSYSRTTFFEERWVPSSQAAGAVSNSFVAAAGNSNFSTPACNSTTARSGITSVPRCTTSRSWWGSAPVCSIVLPRFSSHLSLCYPES